MFMCEQGDEERAQMAAELAAAARGSEDRMAAGPSASQPALMRPGRYKITSQAGMC